MRFTPKCDTETRSEQMQLEKNGADRLAQCRVATDIPCVKNTTSEEHNKARGSRMGSAGSST